MTAPGDFSVFVIAAKCRLGLDDLVSTCGMSRIVGSSVLSGAGDTGTGSLVVEDLFLVMIGVSGAGLVTGLTVGEDVVLMSGGASARVQALLRVVA